MSDKNFGHFAVFKAAWSEQNKADKKKKRKAEEDFLPAALEILEKPPSPLGRAVMWTIIVFVVIAAFWAFLGRVDIVATASGKVLPRERVKVIQASEIGVVRDIHIVDGQAVKQGDPLIDLDEADAGADEEQARQELILSKIDLARGEALLQFLAGEPAIFPADIGEEEPLSGQIVNRQQALVNAQIREFEAKKASLIQQRAERLADAEVNREELAKVNRMLPLLSERVTAQERLVAQDIIPRQQYLDLKEELISLQSDGAIIRERDARTAASILAVEREIDQLEEEFRKTVLAEMAEAEANLGLVREELNKRAVRRGLRSLVAPVDGVVQQLQVNTIGGVVPPAEPLMIIVPGTGELIVEAQVLNKDIGFIKEGDIVEVKLEAFPFTKYGVIDGEIEHISRDAIQDENLGLIFQARIKLTDQEIEVNNRMVNLSPGMSVTAEIKTGKRRIIEFLLAPLLRYRDEALRER